MITVIAGSNRPGNVTVEIARNYCRILHERGEEPLLLTMANLPLVIYSPQMYEKRHPILEEIQEKYLFTAEKFIFVTPEYNGSITGILKAFIDVCDIDKGFKGKKACLVGVASGRAGNLRGLDHLASILHHIDVVVMPNKLPISRVEMELDEHNRFIRTETLSAVETQIDQFLEF